MHYFNFTSHSGFDVESEENIDDLESDSYENYEENTLASPVKLALCMEKLWSKLKFGILVRFDALTTNPKSHHLSLL